MSDDENRSFRIVDEVFENLKPGFSDCADEKHADRRGKDFHGEAKRYPRSDRKDIPRKSLAERIIKATKGG